MAVVRRKIRLRDGLSVVFRKGKHQPGLPLAKDPSEKLFSSPSHASVVAIVKERMGESPEAVLGCPVMVLGYPEMVLGCPDVILGYPFAVSGCLVVSG